MAPETFHVLPPSSVTSTPPLYLDTAWRRHIFGRGRSWMPLATAHARPFTSGSNSIQYVVFTHGRGTPAVELFQLRPPSSLRERPMSV
jgi:hypothetical protein